MPKFVRVTEYNLQRISFRVLYAHHHNPPRNLGYPGDLYIQGSSSSLWYKVDMASPLYTSAEPGGWVNVLGHLGLDRHIHIKHPLRHFHLVASSHGPIWMGYGYTSIVCYSESVEAYVNDLLRFPTESEYLYI